MARILILFIVTLILQTGLLPGLFPTIDTPEMFLPVIVALSIMSSEKTSIAFALTAGIVMDFYFLKAFGVRTLLFFTISYFFSKKRENLSSSVFSVITITLLIGILYQFIYFLIVNIMDTIPFRSLIDSIFSFQIPIIMIYSIICYSILNKEHRRR